MFLLQVAYPSSGGGLSLWLTLILALLLFVAILRLIFRLGNKK